MSAFIIFVAVTGVFILFTLAGEPREMAPWEIEELVARQEEDHE